MLNGHARGAAAPLVEEVLAARLAQQSQQGAAPPTSPSNPRTRQSVLCHPIRRTNIHQRRGSACGGSNSGQRVLAGTCAVKHAIPPKREGARAQSKARVAGGRDPEGNRSAAGCRRTHGRQQIGLLQQCSRHASALHPTGRGAGGPAAGARSHVDLAGLQ